MSDARVVVVVDTETTGLEPGLDRPYEVAWQVVEISAGSIIGLGKIRTKYLQITAEASARIEMLPEAMGVYASSHCTGPTVSDEVANLRAARIVTMIRSESDSKLGPPIWAGVNPGFDLAMLGLAMPESGGFHYTPWDVAQACRARMGLLPWVSKTDVVMERAGVDMSGRHTAAGDVRMTVQMIEWLLADFASSGGG